jgi:Arc/MetJ-type ribon-helix-helix transcriptional regulator
MEEFVRQKVAVGDYETASEVVREGLRLLKQPIISGRPRCRIRSSRAWMPFRPAAALRRKWLKRKWPF